MAAMRCGIVGLLRARMAAKLLRAPRMQPLLRRHAWWLCMHAWQGACLRCSETL
jgi:hypothetical protein